MEDVLKKIVSSYGLEAYEIIAQTPRLWKVVTNVGTVGVKWTQMDEEQLHKWMETYRMANEYNLASVMPVYLTNQQELFIQHRKGIFYVIPWVETPHRDTPPYPFDLFYTTLAELHRRTATSQVVKREDFEQRMEEEKERITNWQDSLEGHVQSFEKKRFMAPFELQVCTHFRDLLAVCRASLDWCDRFLEDIEEDKKIRQCLCHGNVKASHFIYDENKPYLLNWERAMWNYPVFDLTSYYWNMMRYHDAPVEQLITSFSAYEETFPLMNSERSLFAMYVLNADHYLDQVNAYVDGAREIGQPFLVRKLERSYFVLKHALYVQEQLQQARTYNQQKEAE
ncbi:hypothetical protein N784_01435 [Pontibacillus litoralis JSM 072002]|uniref:Aminoglycoside phosphotransferase domain-containing protein n=2 Tax=Pontibacillus TaxID=289201 RepID=A0A0A5GDB8_9BACI|nr:hypothetical protein N784_01435 [Pontibacillus litoralis JSM 072002]